ncbi:MAG: hypothetical protein GX882_02535 [Methanomicrobiales archaeon]|nr:hypothetical protein [Methanomicrobiales archaeon]
MTSGPPGSRFPNLHEQGVPVIFRANETDRPVRVSGHGDPGAQRRQVGEIPRGYWPGPCGRRHNREEVCCPHPGPLLRSGLCDWSIRAVADAEMALSCYA